MNKKLILGTTAFSGLVVSLMPALAQDLGGLRMTFGVDQRFDVGDNLSLDVPSAGSSAVSTTFLTFDALSETRTQTLAFSLGGALRGGNVEDGVETGFVEPSIGLSYERRGANASGFIGANYRESDISFLRQLSEFENEDGVIELPEDFESLNGTGIRQTSRLNARLETGLTDPIGFVFFANATDVTYANLSATSTLDDYQRAAAGATVLFRFSPVSTVFVDASYDSFMSEDAASTDRNTTSLSVGAEHQISATTQVVASLGYSRTDTDEFGITTTEEGVIGSVLWEREMTSGTVMTSFDVTQNQNGRRATLLFGQMLEQPLGSLSYDIGVTDSDRFDANIVGGLNWLRDVPTGNVFARIDRRVTSNSEDNERLFTTVALGYLHDINSVSSITFDASYGASDFDNSNDVVRKDLTVSYNRNLTQDWILSTGASYQIRDEDTVGKADSQSIFLSLRRDFDLLR